MACARCGGVQVIEQWEKLVDNVRDKRLRRIKCVRCVNCGSTDDSVIHENRLFERSALCCTTMFLIVGIVAGPLNLAWVAAVGVQISWILFLIGILLPATHPFTNRSARTS